MDIIDLIKEYQKLREILHSTFSDSKKYEKYKLQEIDFNQESRFRSILKEIKECDLDGLNIDAATKLNIKEDIEHFLF